METLKVNNFAGMNDIFIPLNRINIIIGPQGAGKSVCAKLIYFFKNLIEVAYISLEGEENSDCLTTILKRFRLFFPQESWSHNFNITYSAENTFIKIYKKDGKLFLELTKDLEKVFVEIDSISQKLKGTDSSNAHFVLKCIFSDNLPKPFWQSSIFIPASRSLIGSKLSLNFELDILQNELIKAYKFVLPYLSYEKNSILNFRNKIKHYFEKIIDGELVQDLSKNKWLIKYSDGRIVDLEHISTGQQALLPMLSIISHSYILGDNFNQFVFIEEPEAHLYPTTQKDVVKLISVLINNSEESRFFITSHSPYILSSFNNLLKAGLVKDLQPNKSHKVDLIVPTDEQLLPSTINVFSLGKNGIKNIMDSETGLIQPNILDEVANEITDEFSNLLDIQYGD